MLVNDRFFTIGCLLLRASTSSVRVQGRSMPPHGHTLQERVDAPKQIVGNYTVLGLASQ